MPLDRANLLRIVCIHICWVLYHIQRLSSTRWYNQRRPHGAKCVQRVLKQRLLHVQLRLHRIKSVTFKSSFVTLPFRS